MKHLLPIILIGISLASCKKEDNEINTTPNIIDREGISYIDNVSIVEPEYQFPFETYYTKLDTSVNVRSYTLPIHVLVSEGDSAEVTWNANGLTPIIFSYSKKWEATLQKWKVTSALMCESASTLGKRKIDRTVRFVKSGQSISRSTTINLTKTTKTFDFGRISFGMSRAEVKANEMARFGVKEGEFSGWDEYSPSICYIGSTQFLYGAFTCYEFTDNKLVKISEAYGEDYKDISEEQSAAMSRLFLRFGNKNGLYKKDPITNINVLNAPQSWNYNGLKITFHKREFFQRYRTINSFCLTYEKI